MYLLLVVLAFVVAELVSHMLVVAELHMMHFDIAAGSSEPVPLQSFLAAFEGNSVDLLEDKLESFAAVAEILKVPLAVVVGNLPDPSVVVEENQLVPSVAVEAENRLDPSAAVVETRIQVESSLVGFDSWTAEAFLASAFVTDSFRAFLVEALDNLQLQTAAGLLLRQTVVEQLQKAALNQDIGYNLRHKGSVDLAMIEQKSNLIC